MKKLPTRDIIAQTVLDLLQEQRIEDITVAEIARDVGVSTRTFYNCFKDKYEVCNYLYDKLLDEQCWITNGQRSTLNEFFEHLMEAICGDYSAFFQHTMCYTGQSNIVEHIVERGVEDLKEQLRYTGNAELVTEANITRIEFYMRGLSATLQLFNNASASTKRELLKQDKTSFLPQNMYEALTSALVENKPE